MTSAVGDAAALTDLLAEHQPVVPSVDWVMCMGCDWEKWKGDEDPEELHRVHVAEVLADRVTTARAQALRKAAVQLAAVPIGPDATSRMKEWLSDRADQIEAYRSTENTST